MSSISKGNRIQNELKKKLLDAGYIIDAKVRPRFPKKTHKNDYSQTTDLFGVADIIAKHPKEPDIWWLFQVSTQWKSGKARKEIEDFCWGAWDRVFMVRRKARKKFEFKRFHSFHKEWANAGFL